MATIVNIEEAKLQLSDLINVTLEGNEVIITNKGVPLVTLEKYEQSTKRELGFVKGSLPKSFFDPLPADELEAWSLQ